MSISAPRYSSGPILRVGRVHRTLAIVRRELSRRAGWATMLAVALTFTVMILTLTFNVFFASLTGTLTTATFESPIESGAWPFLILIVTTTAGAGTLAEDIGNRSITLYLSRPIHLDDYLAAKAGACGTWLAIATVAPGLIGIAIDAALGYAPSSIALSAAVGFVATGLLATVFFTGLALALSSLTNRSLYAGVAIFGLVLSLYVGVSVVASITGNSAVGYASPITDLHSAALAAFGIGGSTPTDPAISAIVLAGSGILLTIFAAWRLSRIEVVGE